MKPIISEIAGRDSVAAVLKYCKQNPNKVIVPTYVHTPTEYGEFKQIKDTVKNLKVALAQRYQTQLKELIILKNPQLWRALNGRYISLLISRFGFYSPCIGCHLYMHLMRIPLALKLGSKKIISGERKSHHGEIKINQTAEALEAYAEVLREADIELLFPICDTHKNKEIEEIVGGDWNASEKQMLCVLSGNYRDMLPSKEKLSRYLQEFIIPVGKKLLSPLINDDDNYLSIVAEILGA